MFFVVVIIGFFGFNTIINQTISSRLQPLITRANEEITRAKISAENATETTNSSEKLIKTAAKKVNTYSSQVASLQNTADTLSKQFNEIKRDLDSEASNIRAGSELGLTSLMKRLEKLESFVETIAKDSETYILLLANYKDSLAGLEDQTRRNKSEFQENSKYSVDILFEDDNEDLASEFADSLARVGFKTSGISISPQPNIIHEMAIYASLKRYRSKIKGPAIIYPNFKTKKQALLIQKIFIEIRPDITLQLKRPLEVEAFTPQSPNNIKVVLLDLFEKS